ncbi:MAG: hypothetical protein A2086_06800 [Spirochaetes bacterium GWD1_27_9]|nr:MAG: hypothetical protein A2Z98_04110 [Spirochaetes bacterium GWB1_27_13]OHD20008.1 MAG: hypothetical protein A2Y34_08125 [Spirochaetes bacterium GWC1_27_15]OHD44455.1 MAG: hypothetical protein A2086_06800 [Spirochaetes bacterium GWD1_27_9]
MPIIEYSTMCFNEENYKTKIIETKDLIIRNGFDFGVQIHNSIGKNLFDKILNLQKEIGFKLSVHSPIFAKYFLNLAANNFEIVKTICNENVEYLKKIGTNIFFFHGFFMTDKPIVHDMKNYRKTMLDSINPKFSLNNSSIMNPEFFDTDSFHNYKNIFVSNLKTLKKLYPDFIISLENDFPGIGSGLQRPEEIFTLIENLWFDLGHFWCSSLLYDFDFYDLSDKIIKEKNIVGVHINHNLTKKTDEKYFIYDTHSHLYQKSEQNLKPVVRKLLEKNINILTLEIVDGDIEDAKILLNWLS